MASRSANADGRGGCDPPPCGDRECGQRDCVRRAQYSRLSGWWHLCGQDRPAVTVRARHAVRRASDDSGEPRPGRQSSIILDSDHRRPGDCLCVPYTKEPVRVCADGPFRFPCYLPTTSLLNTFPPCPPCPEGHRRTPRRPSPRGFPRSRLRSSAGATRWSRRSGAPCERPWSGR